MTTTQKNTSIKSTEEDNNSTSSDQLLQIEPIPDTPFNAVKYDDKWFLAMGKYRLTQPSPDKQTILDDANNTTWNRILQIIKIMIDENDKTNK